jgi:hypothetical protein
MCRPIHILPSLIPCGNGWLEIRKLRYFAAVAEEPRWRSPASKPARSTDGDAEIGCRGDASASWIVTVVTGGAYAVGQLDRDGREEVWGDNRNAAIAGSLNLSGTAALTVSRPAAPHGWPRRR